MKDSDYNDLIELVYMGGGFIPHNQKAIELSETLTRGEVIALKECTQRDVSFHRCYFLLLNFIYGYLPASFQKKIPKEEFYIWLKTLKKDYEIRYTFADGSKMIKYNSLSFGKMSQKKFEEYVREQLPWIYENVLGAFYSGDIYNNIIDTIEEEFKKFLSKL